MATIAATYGKFPTESGISCMVTTPMVRSPACLAAAHDRAKAFKALTARRSRTSLSNRDHGTHPRHSFGPKSHALQGLHSRAPTIRDSRAITFPAISIFSFAPQPGVLPFSSCSRSQQLSGYRLVDWLAVFGFRLDDISRLYSSVFVNRVRCCSIRPSTTWMREFPGFETARRAWPSLRLHR